MLVKIKLNKKLYIVSFITILSFLLIARDVFSISINKFVYLLICATYLFFADEVTKISLISFLLPLMCGIPSTYILLVIMILLISKNRIKPITLILCFIYAVLELSGMFYLGISLNSTVIKQILFIWVFFSMLYTVENVNYTQCMKLYMFGTILVSFVIDAYSIMRAPSNWLYLFANGWYRFGLEGLEDMDQIMTLRLNPISLGYFCTSGVLIGMVLIVQTKGRERVWVSVGVFFLTITAMLAVSRSFVLVIFGCLMLIAFNSLKHVQNYGKILALTSLAVLVGYIVYRVYPEIFSAMINRMTSSSMDGGNGRVELMVEYLEALLSDSRRMLIGTGAAYSMIAIGADVTLHNAPLQILISFGIWGGIIFLIAMHYPLLRENNEGRAEFIYWIPFIGTFVYIQTIQFLYPCYLMMPYVMAVYAVKAGRQKNKRLQV